MNIKNRLLKATFNIRKEGFKNYFLNRFLILSSRVSTPFSWTWRKFRYRLVGLIYGYKFDYDSVRLAQLECFCHELAAYSLSQNSKLQNIRNMEVASLLKLSEDAFQRQNFAEALSLLDRASCIDAEYPSLAETYARYSEGIYLETGIFEDLHFRASLGALKSLKYKYYESCFFNPFGDSSKILDSVWTGAIGHLGLLAQFIQAKKIGLLPENNIRYVVVSNRVANACYLSYLCSLGEIDVIHQNDYKYFYDYGLLPFCESLEVWQTKDGYEDLSSMLNKVYERWRSEKRSPLLKIESDHRERGLKVLEDLNIPADAWFVSFHVRSGSSGKNNRRDGRNCEIDSYIPAIKAITDAGGYVFRMGDHTIKPLPEMSNVVDYALSPYKSDWMDVFLWACCRFFVGTNSGPVVIPPSFGVPQLCTNVSPFAIFPSLPNSLMIPKLWYSRTKQRLLTFSEMLASPAAWCERRTLGDDLVLVDNTPDELADGIREMIELTQDGIAEGQYDIVKDLSNPLQIKLYKICETYKAYGKLPLSRPFLEKYATLIA
ncbi:TIGR04372 family glycosyltransferase [Phormidium sp. FACHB-1136]|uniref:TIGR04372 family glycosyltransferase n=1 Tax=Phormidium sp. FACHB-1136 TaxID=2692848 RepID=UPI00321F76D3